MKLIILYTYSDIVQGVPEGAPRIPRDGVSAFRYSSTFPSRTSDSPTRSSAFLIWRAYPYCWRAHFDTRVHLLPGLAILARGRAHFPYDEHIHVPNERFASAGEHIAYSTSLFLGMNGHQLALPSRLINTGTKSGRMINA